MPESINTDLSRLRTGRLTRRTRENPVVTDEVVYMTADEEDNYHVAQANEQLDAEGHFVRKNVSGRYREETQEYERSKFDYMDVSPKMVFFRCDSTYPIPWKMTMPTVRSWDQTCSVRQYRS